MGDRFFPSAICFEHAFGQQFFSLIRIEEGAHFGNQCRLSIAPLLKKNEPLIERRSQDFIKNDPYALPFFAKFFSKFIDVGQSSTLFGGITTQGSEDHDENGSRS
jgi:hypothetical protein